MLCVLGLSIKHAELTFAPKKASHKWQHPKNLNAVFCGGREIGEIGLIYPTVSKKLDKKAAIVYAEIDVAGFARTEFNNIKYSEVSRFPEMSVDLNFMSDTFLPVREAIEKLNCALIKKFGVIDTYADANGKSITTRLIFAHPERTLTGDEVKEQTDKLIALLAEKSIFLKQ